MSRVLVRGVVLLALLGVPSAIRAQDARETLFWESVECDREAEVRVYLEVYPAGAYVAEAWACLEEQLGLDRSARLLVQRGLASLDYAAGAADGLFGPTTRAALRQWQRGKGFAATGYLTREQAEALIAQGHEAVHAAVERARAETERQRQAREAAAQVQKERQPRVQERSWEWVNSLGMEFVRIEPGTFQMGSPAGEPGRDDDEVGHGVRLSQPYYLGKYEVTQAQWQAVMGTNPSHFQACGGSCPVELVSWEDAQEFITALNRREGTGRYRLPTEAEWEYAARAGTQTALYTGGLTIHGKSNAPTLDAIAWYGGNSGVSYAEGDDCSEWDEKQYASSWCGTHPVGQKQANRWGLYDILGNVWEWVADRYGEYPSGLATDPRGPSTGASRVLRGGSWDHTARICRAANRDRLSPGSRFNTLGFRLARTP